MGSTAQAVLGQIIAGEGVSALKKRGSVPANVDAALRKALEKLPADRFASAQDFVRALADEHFRYGALATVGPDGATEGPWNRLTLAFAGVTILFAVALGWTAFVTPSSSPLGPITYMVSLPDTLQASRFSLSFAPGGTELVMSGTQGLLVREVTDLDTRFIDLGVGAELAFSSPDGSWVGYFNEIGQRVERVPPGGGAPVPITEDVVLYFGGTWGSGDTIVYSPGIVGGLWQVSADGGSPRQLTTPDTSAGEPAHASVHGCEYRSDSVVSTDYSVREWRTC